MTCDQCAEWQIDVDGWGECHLKQTRMFVKFPEQANVRAGDAVLLTMHDFGCVEFRQIPTSESEYQEELTDEKHSD